MNWTDIIPLQSVPSQTLSVILGGQICDISLYQLGTGVFMDMSVNDTQIITCRAVVLNQPIVRMSYTGFIGDMIMIDTQGSSQPDYSGFGTRWLLAYGS
jgi:hypothetical protein